MNINSKKSRKVHTDCPHCNPKNTCPHCARPFNPWRESLCVLNHPLMMVIPPEGVHLDCPIHPEGHHIFGSPVTWMESPIWKSNSKPMMEFDSGYRPVEYDSTQRIVEFDSTRPWRTTGDNIL